MPNRKQVRAPLTPSSGNSRLPKKSSIQKKPTKKRRAPSQPSIEDGEVTRVGNFNRSGENEPITHTPYTPLGPRIDHKGEPLLPWEGPNITIVQIFELFWDEEAIELLVVGTNAYAKEKGAGAETQRRWKRVTGNEIRVFLALLIYMGARRGMGSQGFWRYKGRDSILRTMSLKRFSQIKRYLHISDPKQTLSPSHWHHKLEPLNSLIRKRCQQYYLPSSNVTADEMMIRFGGRSHHTYRMPSKPIKEGYKVFALFNMGYTYNWMFASRSKSFAELIPQEGLTPTGSAVFQLAAALPYTSGLHFNIYMDNYFPLIALFERLREVGLGACGTAQVNRKAYPPHLDNKRFNIPWNEVSGGSACPSGTVLALQWQDNSAVHFLSTIHNLEDRVSSERKKPRLSSSNGPAIRRVFGVPERAKVSIPVITNDYNQYKVGVDVADQYRSYYFTQLKCLRNWPPIFYWLLDTMVINSYLLARQLPSPSTYHGCSRTFRLTLAESIVTKYASSQVP